MSTITIQDSAKPGAQGLATVPPGYKWTEVGTIPYDWQASRLGDCGDVVMGQSPPGSSYNRTGIGSPLINGPTEFTDLHPVKIQWTTQPTRFCKPGDLLICVRGSSTGRTNYADDTYAIGRGVAAIRAKGDNDTEYLSYQVISGMSAILAEATGSTFPSVDGASFRKIVLPLPSSTEQRAIAGALTDVDDLISALDKLIAKKRAIKQAAMQQLLTGKTRLPGFTGEWETKRLGDIADIHRQNAVPAMTPEQLFMHFSLPAFDDGQLPVVEPGVAIGSNKFRVPKQAVLVSKLNPRIPRVWAPTYIPMQAVASTEFLVLTPNETTSRKFLFVLCSSPSFCEQMELNATGTTGSHQRISPKEAMRIEIGLPEDSTEQNAIAAVLSDMDTEITALEQRRDKTKSIKQGMMQELLTGRTRLI